MPEALWKQNVGLVCQIISAVGALASTCFGIRYSTTGGTMPAHVVASGPSVWWLVGAGLLFAYSVGGALYNRFRLKKTIHSLQEQNRINQVKSEEAISALSGQLGKYAADYTAAQAELRDWKVKAQIADDSASPAKSHPLPDRAHWEEMRKDMQLVMNRSFSNQEDIELDGRSFVGCSFANSSLLYNATAPAKLFNCTFDERTRARLRAGSPAIAQWSELLRMVENSTHPPLE
jgi:hypothetical protein